MKARTNFIWPEVLMMKEFVDRQNSLVANFIKNFDQEVQVVFRKELMQTSPDDEGTIVGREIRLAGKLTEEDWDLEETFLELMPAYLLGSSLMAVWSIFEKEMERMYGYVSREYFDGRKLARKKPGVSKIGHLSEALSEFGLGRNISEELDEAIGHLNDEVRLVRNAWAHNGGEDIKGSLGDDVEGINIKGSKIIISSEYIGKVLDSMEVSAKIYNKAIYSLKKGSQKPSDQRQAQ